MLHFMKEKELIEDGKYEANLKLEWAETKAKDKYIKVIAIIRTDVNQKFGGTVLFDGIFKSKFTGDYSQAKIVEILKAINSSKYDFEDYDELILFINDKNVLIDVGTIAGDITKQTTDRNIIKSYLPSLVPTTKTDNAIVEGNVSGIDIKEDDLPF